MKKKYILLSFSLAANSFSFWELDGPFGQRQELGKIMNENGQLLQPIERLNKDSKFSNIFSFKFEEPHGYFFLYNSQIGYSIGCNKNGWQGNQNLVNFLLGSNNTERLQSGYNDIESELFGLRPKYYKLYEICFYFIKEGQDLIFEGSIKPNLGSYQYQREIQESEPNDDKLKEKLNQIKVVNAKKEFIVDSNIGIENRKQGEVKVIKGDQVFDFQPLLVNYFDKTKKRMDLAVNITHLLKQKNPSDPTIKDLDPKLVEKFSCVMNVGEGEITRLKNSRILSVYAVIKNEKGQNAIIWGLAEDKNDVNKRRFHWITDLEGDFSTLLDK